MLGNEELRTEDTDLSTEAKLDRYLERIKGSFEEFLKASGVQPYGSQRDFVDTIQKLTQDPNERPKRFFCKAGTGTGKTILGAGAALWRVVRFSGERAILSSPTERQLRKNTMREVRKLISQNPYLNMVMEAKGGAAYFKGYPDWGVETVTASDPDNVKGYHSPKMTVFLEEVTGIREDIMEMFFRTCSQKENLLYGIFNPDKTVGVSYESFTTKKHAWPHNMTMDKMSIAKENPDIVDPQSIEDLVEMYGEDSDAVQVGVYGNYPLQGEKEVIPRGLYWKQQEETDFGRAFAMTPEAMRRRVVAIDFARMGRDLSVITYRSGNAVLKQDVYSRTEPTDVIKRAMEFIFARNWQEDVTLVLDTIGVGGGAAGLAYDAGLYVHEFNGRRKSPDPAFKDMLTYSWFMLQRVMKNYPVFLPHSEELEAQLTTRQYSYEAKDGYRVETKKEYANRGYKKSPDHSDSLTMAFCVDQNWEVPPPSSASSLFL